MSSDTWTAGPVPRKRRRWNKVLGIIVGFTLAASVAFAAWTLLNRTGQGGVNIGTLQDVIVSQNLVGNSTDGRFDSLPFPGGSAAVTVQLNNLNTVPIKLVALHPNGTPEVLKNGGNNADCAGSIFVTVNDLTGLSISVPPGLNLVQIPGGVTLGANAPTQCQGSVVRLPVSLDFST